MNRSTASGVLVFLALLTAGCPWPDDPIVAADAGAADAIGRAPDADDVGRDGSAEAAETAHSGYFSEGPVWTADSVTFRLEQRVCGAGCTSEYFEPRRPNEAQTRALERLTTTSFGGTCPADGTHAYLNVFDKDGRERRFVWHKYPCGPEPQLQGLADLVATVPRCGGPTPAGDGCTTYVPLSAPGRSWQMQVNAGDAYTISLRRCEGQTVIRLKSGGTVLATGKPTADACSQIEHRFEDAGLYDVTWDLVPGGAWAFIGAERIP